MLERALESTIRQVSQTFPVLLLTGPRQVGKTTLLRHMTEAGRGYISLDDLDARLLAQNDPTFWARLAQMARDADLPERCRPLLDKAKGLTQALLLTLRFFITTGQRTVEALNWPPELEALLPQHLIPAIYLDRVAERCGKAEERQRLRQLPRNGSGLCVRPIVHWPR